MTISSHVRSQLFEPQAINLHQPSETRVIRLPPTVNGKATQPTRRCGTPWTTEEHDRFLKGLEIFPSGPWKEVAAYVGTRSARQTMTHAQKYREKIARNTRGARTSSNFSERMAKTEVEEPLAQGQPAMPSNEMNSKGQCKTTLQPHEENGVLLHESVHGDISDIDHEMAVFLSEILFTDSPDAEQEQALWAHSSRELQETHQLGGY